MADEPSAILEWINTFNLKSRPRTITDITDGFILAKILHDIDPKFFPEPASAPQSHSWVIRFNSLKRLHKQLQKYYTNVLAHPPPKIVPNISAIAKDASKDETVKLFRLLILTAVQSERREIYIGKIRSLSRTAQTDLMHAIEKATAQEKPAHEHSHSSSNTSSPTPFHFEEQMATILREKDSLLKANKDLDSQLAQTKSDYEQLQKENETLSKTVQDSEIATKSYLDKADQHLRSQIESIRAEVTCLEAKLAERDITIHEQSGQISQLCRKVEDLLPSVDENRHLRDQIQELSPLVEKSHKLENIVEKYRKKIEEGNDLVKQLQEAEERSLSLSAELQKTQDHLAKLEASAILMESYKREIATFQDSHSARARERVALDHQLDTFTKEKKEYELEKIRDAEHIQLLQDRLKEYETESPKTLDQISSNLQIEMNGETRTEMKLKINQLQRELDAIRRSDDSSSEFLILKALYSDALAVKEKFEKEIIGLHQEKLSLQREFEAMQSFSPEKSRYVTELRERCLKAESQVEAEYQVEAESQVVEEKKKLVEYQVDGSNESERSQNIDLLDRLLVNDLQKELLQRSSKQRKDSNSTANDDTETSAKTGDQDRVAELAAQLDEMKRKMTRAKEFIKKQDIVMKEKDLIIKNTTHATSAESQITQLKVSLFPVSLTIKQSHEETVAGLRRELQLMSSAWYNLSNRMQRDNVVIKRSAASPTSWLSNQRQNLDVRIRPQISFSH
ncbi:Protein Hook 2 [Neolecta irregularis DAH-3]|uniref:Protein Hook 2 n=1 Tax=Neolecta irregularis (strain DAH-3) TaxID=1198029 RepID=A0A1U7LMM0_NEOID|nr:Protein Hook 2 [Neolecta irregularis DAH-3]|eukprot:OLL23897.1 Protein Hook 2 [Neolecta irregularis DAH-3]